MSEFNYACDKCPRTFKLEEFYDKHKKVHELKKQHKCDICGYVYGAAKGLEGHIKTHTDEEIAAAHQANRKVANGQQNGQTSPGGTPYGVDFHFLNPQGVLAQAKLPVSPNKKDTDAEVLRREALNGKAPSPAGTGNYIVYGKSELNLNYLIKSFTNNKCFLKTPFRMCKMPMRRRKTTPDSSCAPFASGNFPGSTA